MPMNRDLILPVVAVMVGVCAILACAGRHRGRRRAPDVSTKFRQPLQVWEEEGGAVLDAAGPRPAQPASGA